MKRRLILVSTTALAVACGCSQMSESMEERKDHTIAVERLSEPGNWEIRKDAPQAQLRTEPSESPATVSQVNLPPQVRFAAEHETDGEIESAEFYEAGDTTVYVLHLACGDGSRELTIREDGVVLLNRRNPATRQVVADEPALTVRDWRDRE